MEWHQTFRTGPRLIAPPPPPPAPAPGPAPLSAILLPAGLQVGKSDGTSQFTGAYNGATLTDPTDGLVRLGPVLDPGGSGQTVYIHRVLNGDTIISGGVRSEELFEQSYSGMRGTIVPGTRCCFGFAVRIKGGEMEVGASSNDAFLFQQTHTPMQGDTQPPLAFRFASKESSFTNTLTVAKAWQSNAPVAGATDNAAPNGGTALLYRGNLPAVDTWTKFIVDGVWSWQASDNPFINIYASFDGGVYSQIVADAGVNDYNPGGSSANYSYLRIGLYKWTTGVWAGTDRIAVYETPIYFGQGAGLIESAKAAMAAL
jgi:hypothetical protein